MAVLVREELHFKLFVSLDAQEVWIAGRKAFINGIDFCISTAESQADHNVYDPQYR